MMDDAAGTLLVLCEAQGVTAFLVEQLGHRIRIGLADEQRALARDLMASVLPDWTLLQSRSSMSLDPAWTGIGGAGIDVSFWQQNDLGERERVGVRGTERILRHENFVRVSLGDNDVQALPSYISEPKRHRPRFPVDAVISWVDDSDDDWRSRVDAARASVAAESQSVDVNRFRSRQELKYLLRSIERFAPFVHRIFIVTDCRVPAWLNETDPMIEVVNQTALLGGEPVFNSLAVESALHHIEGLSEHYVYFNDDMFLARPIEPELFFSPAGQMRLTQGPRIRAGAPRAGENAFETAAKVARELVSQHCGWTPEYNTNHVPLPQRRSIASAAEEQFGAAIAATRTSTFREAQNTTTASGLFHYFGADMGLTGQSAMQWDYIDTGGSFARSQYADLLARPHVDVFCCNDASSSSSEQSGRDLTAFLEQYFSGPGRFEVSTAKRA